MNTNPYLSTNQPTLSREAIKLLTVVKHELSNSYRSEFFMFNKKMMKASGLYLDELRAAQRELMNFPLDLIEYGRLGLQTRNGGCLYSLTPA